MPSTSLILIPIIPELLPDPETLIATKDILRDFYKTQEIKFVITENVEFVDPGQNFESVACNLCRQAITIEDWHQAMDAAYINKFKDLKFITCCCQKTTSLNDLEYIWPAGFSKFTIMIADAAHDLTDEQMKLIETVMQTKLRKIWAHY
jgi:hypothetical protein